MNVMNTIYSSTLQEGTLYTKQWSHSHKLTLYHSDFRQSETAPAGATGKPVPHREL